MKKKHKHSPGPWAFRNAAIWSADGFLVAAINIEDNQHMQPKGFARANGQLLAAGPEALEALLAAETHIRSGYGRGFTDKAAEQYCPALRQVRAAIAMATRPSKKQLRPKKS